MHNNTRDWQKMNKWGREEVEESCNWFQAMIKRTLPTMFDRKCGHVSWVLKEMDGSNNHNTVEGNAKRGLEIQRRYASRVELKAQVQSLDY